MGGDGSQHCCGDSANRTLHGDKMGLERRRKRQERCPRFRTGRFGGCWESLPVRAAESGGPTPQSSQVSGAGRAL